MSQHVVYVGGLTDATSDHQLRELFGTYGSVTRAYVIRHKHSGKSAGYGFVEMMSGQQASCAVAALEGAVFQGNCLRLFVMPSISASQ
ncbi:MAG: RNA-binding protein [Nitrospira sp.]|jgi:RNA recognition motif-containing protein|nr:RNA-binding protein [Nitrospira sp.]MDH4246120.1 RNA-binding protein [Nitrospira sp.]MDH4357109.1 RNA-binding protein [Nitrospira sp.]MDH5318155.1 RNA-binding protein [Nitrospira sp.]